MSTLTRELFNHAMKTGSFQFPNLGLDVDVDTQGKLKLVDITKNGSFECTTFTPCGELKCDALRGSVVTYLLKSKKETISIGQVVTLREKPKHVVKHVIDNPTMSQYIGMLSNLCESDAIQIQIVFSNFEGGKDIFLSRPIAITEVQTFC